VLVPKYSFWLLRAVSIASGSNREVSQARKLRDFENAPQRGVASTPSDVTMNPATGCPSARLNSRPTCLGLRPASTSRIAGSR
jgi:hypothetical protein